MFPGFMAPVFFSITWPDFLKFYKSRINCQKDRKDAGKATSQRCNDRPVHLEVGVGNGVAVDVDVGRVAAEKERRRFDPRLGSCFLHLLNLT